MQTEQYPSCRFIYDFFLFINAVIIISTCEQICGIFVFLFIFVFTDYNGVLIMKNCVTVQDQL